MRVSQEGIILRRTTSPFFIPFLFNKNNSELHKEGEFWVPILIFPSNPLCLTLLTQNGGFLFQSDASHPLLVNPPQG